MISYAGELGLEKRACDRTLSPSYWSFTIRPTHDDHRSLGRPAAGLSLRQTWGHAWRHESFRPLVLDWVDLAIKEHADWNT